MNTFFNLEKYTKQAERVEDNYTKMPNIVLDSIMSQISANAFKCLNVIIRCTIGYQKSTHPISQSVFMELTGIKRKETVIDAIRELEQLKIIFVDRSTHTNTFSLTLSQYEKTVSVRKNRTEIVTTEKPYQQDTENAYSNSTEKPYIYKEINKKENNNIKNTKKFSFYDALKNLGADEELIQDWLTVRKTKKASNTQTAFNQFKKQFDQTQLDINTVLKICIERDWKGFNTSWLVNINPSDYQNQNINRPNDGLNTQTSGFTFQLPTKPKCFLGDN